MIDLGLIVGFAGIFVAGLAGILGVWMERERDNPPWFALFFSVMIGFASVIEVGHTVYASYEDSVAEDAMADVLQQLTEISEKSGDPALASFVGAELSRSDPKLVRKVEKKVAARGGDPAAVKRRAAEGRTGKAKAGAGAGAGAGAEDPGAGGGEGKVGKGGKAGKAGGTDGGEPTEGAPEEGTPTEGTDPAEGKAGKAGKAGGAGEGKAGKAGKAG